MFRILITALTLFALVGCSGYLAPTSSLEQPSSDRINTHLVSKGETLYSIAWRYGKDYRDLAAINGIAPPYLIRPGQRLQLEGRKYASVPSPTPTKKSKTSAKKAGPAAVPKRKNTKLLTSKKKRPAAPGRVAAKIRWHWPARGQLINGFRAGDPLRKGVDIAGEKGDSVVAAANGTVIYAGSALRGYGKLLIVKHSGEYLSAYAHNDKLLVGEGSAVKAGQRIAELGSSGTDRNKLHFEIRRNGQPVDPLAYLPRPG
ncbi:peptidoglycan DD-metalloendopeptidase family protein [Microbulbifer sp. 2201CG32-9]|uniref:peptidoglycan DD-metalloendopeptidase family protein n=1 Tax=Microbulbifer sp. 2201CG32-9 TaxID=3232309 RepID=UPI00345BBB4D